MRYAILAAIVLMALATPDAFGQTGDITEAVLPVDLSTRSSVNSGKSVFVLSATQNDKNATIRLTNKLPGRDELWHVTLSGPLDKSSDRTELAGLHGLNGKASIEFGLQKRFGKMTGTMDLSPQNAERNVARYKELCHRAGLKDDCDLFLTNTSQAELAKIVKVAGKIQLLSASAGYSSDTFRYLDASTLAPGKQRHPGFSAEGAYTILPMWWNTLYSVSLKYQYQNQFTAGTQKQLCRPSVAGSLECGSAIVGAPSRNRGRALALESRWYAGDGFAVQPLVSRDTVARSTSIELPVYFVRNGDGKLAGGVTVGWDSKEREVNAAIFVGSVLNALTK
jgi:hypothetical protein